MPQWRERVSFLHPLLNGENQETKHKTNMTMFVGRRQKQGRHSHSDQDGDDDSIGSGSEVKTLPTTTSTAMRTPVAPSPVAPSSPQLPSPQTTTTKVAAARTGAVPGLGAPQNLFAMKQRDREEDDDDKEKEDEEQETTHGPLKPLPPPPTTNSSATLLSPGIGPLIIPIVESPSASAFLTPNDKNCHGDGDGEEWEEGDDPKGITKPSTRKDPRPGALAAPPRQQLPPQPIPSTTSEPASRFSPLHITQRRSLPEKKLETTTKKGGGDDDRNDPQDESLLLLEPPPPPPQNTAALKYEMPPPPPPPPPLSLQLVAPPRTPIQQPRSKPEQRSKQSVMMSSTPSPSSSSRYFSANGKRRPVTTGITTPSRGGGNSIGSPSSRFATASHTKRLSSEPRSTPNDSAISSHTPVEVTAKVVPSSNIPTSSSPLFWSETLSSAMMTTTSKILAPSSPLHYHHHQQQPIILPIVDSPSASAFLASDDKDCHGDEGDGDGEEGYPKERTAPSSKGPLRGALVAPPQLVKFPPQLSQSIASTSAAPTSRFSPVYVKQRRSSPEKKSKATPHNGGGDDDRNDPHGGSRLLLEQPAPPGTAAMEYPLPPPPPPPMSPELVAHPQPRQQPQPQKQRKEQQPRQSQFLAPSSSSLSSPKSTSRFLASNVKQMSSTKRNRDQKNSNTTRTTTTSTNTATTAAMPTHDGFVPPAAIAAAAWSSNSSTNTQSWGSSVWAFLGVGGGGHIATPGELQKANLVKWQLLQELSHVKVALDAKDTERDQLEHSVQALVQETISLRTALKQALQQEQVAKMTIQQETEQVQRRHQTTIHDLSEQLALSQTENSQLQSEISDQKEQLQQEMNQRILLQTQHAEQRQKVLELKVRQEQQERERQRDQQAQSQLEKVTATSQEKQQYELDQLQQHMAMQRQELEQKIETIQKEKKLAEQQLMQLQVDRTHEREQQEQGRVAEAQDRDEQISFLQAQLIQQEEKILQQQKRFEEQQRQQQVALEEKKSHQSQYEQDEEEDVGKISMQRQQQQNQFVQSLQEENQKLQEQVSELELEHRQVTEKCEALKTELTAKTADWESRQLQMDEKEEQIFSLRLQVEELKHDLERNVDSIEEPLRQRMARAAAEQTDKLNQQRNEIADLRSSLGLTQNELETALQLVQSNDEKFQERTNTVANAEESNNKIVVALQSVLDQKQNELQAAMELVQSKEKELQEQMERFQVTKTNTSHVDMEGKELVSTEQADMVNQREQEIATLKLRLNELENEIEQREHDANCQLEETKSALERVIKLVKSKEERASVAESKWTKAQHELENFQKLEKVEANQREKEISTLQSKIENLETEIEKRECDTNRLRGDAESALEEKHKALEALTRLVKTKDEELEKRVLEMENEMGKRERHANDQLEEAKSALDTKQEALEKVIKHVKSKEERASEAEARRTKAEQELEHLRMVQTAEVKQRDEEIAALQSKIRQLEKETKKRESDTRRELEEAKSDLDDKQEALEALTRLVKSKDEEFHERLSDAEARRTKVEHALEHLRKSQMTTVDQREGETAALHLKIRQLEMVIEERESETKRDFQKAQSALDEKQDALEALNRLVTSKDEELQKRVSDAEEGREVVEKELIATRVEMAAQKEIVEAKMREELSLLSKTDHLGKEKESSQRDILELQTGLESTGTALKATVKLCQSLENKLTEARSQYGENEKQYLAQLEEKDRVLNTYKLDSDSKVQHLMKDLQSKDNILRQHRDLIQNLETSQASLAEKEHALAKEVEMANSEKTRLEVELHGLATQIEEATSEKEVLKDERDRLRGDLLGAKKDAAESYDRLVEQLESGTAHGTEQKDSDLFATKQLLQETQDKLDTMNSHLEATKDQVVVSTKKIQTLQEERNGIQRQCHDLEIKLDKSTRETTNKIANLISQLETTKEETSASNKKFEFVQEKKDDVQEQFLEMKNELDKGGRELTDNISTLESHLEILKTQVVDASNRIQTLQEERDSAQRRSHDLATELEKDSRECEKEVTLTSHLETRKEQIVVLTTTIQSLQEERDGVQQRYQDLEAKLDKINREAKSKIISLDSQLEAAIEEVSVSKKKMESLLEERDNIQQQYLELKDELHKGGLDSKYKISTLESHLETLKEQGIVSSKRIQTLQEERDIAQRRCHDLATELEKKSEKEVTLTSHLETRKEEVVVLTTTVQSLKEERDDVQQRFQDLETKVDKINREAKNKIISLESQLETTKEEVFVSNKRIESFQQERDNIQQRCLDLNNELDRGSCESKDKISTLESHLETLKEQGVVASKRIQTLQEDRDINQRRAHELAMELEKNRHDWNEKEVTLMSHLEKTKEQAVASTKMIQTLQEERDGVKRRSRELGIELDQCSRKSKDEIATLEAQLVIMKEKITHATKKIQSLEAERVDIEQQSLGLGTELDKRIRESTDKISTLELHLESTTEQLSVATTTIQSLEKESAVLHRRSHELENELDKSRRESKDMEDKLEILKVQLKHTTDEAVVAANAIHNLQLDRDAIQEQSLVIENELCKSRRESKDMNDKIIALESQLDTTRKQVVVGTKSIQALQAERDASLQRSHELETELEKLTSESKDTIVALESHLEYVKEQVAVATKTIQTLQDERGAIQEKSDKLENELDKNRRQFENKIATLESRLEDTTRQAAASAVTINSLQEEKNAAQHRSLELENELEKSRDESKENIVTLKSNLKSRKEEIVAASKIIETLQQESDSVRQQSLELETKLEKNSRESINKVVNLESQLETLKAQVGVSTKTIQTLQAEKDVLHQRSQLASIHLEDELDKIRHESNDQIVSLQFHVESLKENAATATKTIQALQEEKGTIRQRNLELGSLLDNFRIESKDKIVNLESQVDALKKQVVAGTEKIQTLQGERDAIQRRSLKLENELNKTRRELKDMMVALQSELNATKEHVVVATNTIQTLQTERDCIQQKAEELQAELEKSLRRKEAVVEKIPNAIDPFETDRTMARELLQPQSTRSFSEKSNTPGTRMLTRVWAALGKIMVFSVLVFGTLLMQDGLQSSTIIRFHVGDETSRRLDRANRPAPLDMEQTKDQSHVPKSSDEQGGLSTVGSLRKHSMPSDDDL